MGLGVGLGLGLAAGERFPAAGHEEPGSLEDNMATHGLADLPRMTIPLNTSYGRRRPKK